MKIFADTANLEELKELLSWGIIDGVTTNPIIISKEGGVDFETRMKEILRLFKGMPISIEVTTNDLDEMVKEALHYASWGDNAVIKIPMGVTGLKAVKILSEKGVKTNVTACMSMNQAVLAAKAGGTYVSLFWGRIEDMGYDALRIVEDTRRVFDKHNFNAEIIVGSLREVSHASHALLSGAHVLTIPTSVLKKMPLNPRTESTIKEFLDTWEAMQNAKRAAASTAGPSVSPVAQPHRDSPLPEARQQGKEGRRQQRVVARVQQQ